MNTLKKKIYRNKVFQWLSGKLEVDGTEYTEPKMNGFKERIPDQFDTDDYQVLLVAEKYQTGF